MKKRLLSILLCICMLCSLLPTTALATAGTTVKVGGVTLHDGYYLANGSTEATTTEPTTGGYAYFSGGTLTLKNFNYRGDESGVYSDSALTIVLEGANKISTTATGRGGNHSIWVQADLRIIGTSADEDSLTVNSSDDNNAIMAYNEFMGYEESITIENVTITATGTGDAGIVASESLTIKNSVIVSEGAKYGLQGGNFDNKGNDGNITISNSTIKARGNTKAFESAPNITDTDYKWRATYNGDLTDSATPPDFTQTYLELFMHTHCICGATHSNVGDHTDASEQTFTAWTSSTELPTTEGNYYLTTDVKVRNGAWEFWTSGNIVLCLNGHTITRMDANGYGASAIKVVNGTFTLTDCGTTGKITHDTEISGNGVVVAGGTFNMYGGTITRNEAQYGGGVIINSGAFHMYGGTITCNEAQYGGGVYISSSSSTFNMYGGTISGNTATNNGGGVCVSSSSTFNMYGGEISGNTVDNAGGGVSIIDSGAFHMYGGTITRNEAQYGGGVYMGGLNGVRTFTMSGGTISGNTATNEGGGVCVSSSGSTFTMSGGSITGNKVLSDIGAGGGVYVGVQNTVFNMYDGEITGNSAADGGGVCLYRGAFTMTGGTITGNNAFSNGGGVYKTKSAPFKVSGTPVITGNTLNGTQTNNVYCGGTIKITDTLNTGAKIGVNKDSTGIITSAWSTYMSDKTPGDYFESDAGLDIKEQNGELYLVEPHTHGNWTYSYSSATKEITAACGNAGCTDPTYSETLTISASDEIYDGSSKTATLGEQSGLKSELKDATITYKQGETTLESAPTNVGTYTASITVGTDESAVTASVEYTIAPKSVTGATVGTFGSLTYTGEAQTPAATVTIDGLTVTGTWSNVTNVSDTTTFTASGNFTGTISDQDPGMAKKTVDALDLSSIVTAPVKGGTPQSSVADQTQYTGTISWEPAHTSFLGGTAYTATLTLTATANYTLTGVGANKFTYTDATVENAADSGTVTIAFPAIANAEVSSIAIQTPADKTAYQVGDTLDVTGLVITATMDDGTTDDVNVTSDMVSGFDSSAVAASQTLTITYGGKTTTYSVSIKEGTMTGITAEGYSGAYDGAAHGITVNNVPDDATVKYGTSADACTEDTLTYTNFTDGIQTVYYRVTKYGYTDVTGSTTVNITKKDITGATVGGFTPMAYTGEAQTPVATVTIDGLTVTGTWSDVTNVGDTTTFTASGNFTGTITGKEPGMAKKTVDALDLSSIVTAPVKGGTPQSSITHAQYTGTISWEPAHTSFLGGTAYTATLTLTATANYTLTGVGANKFTYTDATVENAADSGTVTIVFPAIANAEVSSIAIKTAAKKTTYQVGDMLDVTGLVITVTMDDGTTADVSVTGDMVSGFDSTAAASSQTLTITYGGKTTTYSVSISKSDQTAPAAPTAAGKTSTSVTLNAITTPGQGDVEYAVNTTNAAPTEGWQTGTTFTGLSAETTYYFFARYSGNDNYNAAVSGASEPVTTDPTPVHSFGLDQSGTYTFPAATVGYTEAPEALSVTVTNTGNQPTGELTVSLGGNADKFTLSTDKIGSLDNANDTATFTVVPKPGLAAGSYLAQVVVSNGAGTQDFSVTFTVKPSTYAITVADCLSGTVTASAAEAAQGDTVTLTVKADKHYALSKLTVTSEDGQELTLTDKGNGTFTFTMPAGKVTVKAEFSWKNPFVDVAENAYYAPAVEWALKNGITAGTSATTFAPNASCTRAQAVTFLWRAAGSPAPGSTEMPFIDVAADAYYYDAVLWAVENGITAGTSATTFSPNAVCTRAQAVAFLWRAAGSPAPGSAKMPFADISAKAYYRDAVLWAVEEGVTVGTGKTTFSPNAVCTRAQAVTFLYRNMAG